MTAGPGPSLDTMANSSTSVLPPGFKSRRIVPQEWIQDYFSPVMGVMACNDTENLCRKNNLTFVEMLQPFGKLLTDVTVKDPDGVNHSVNCLNILFQDHRRDPSRVVNSKLMYDMISEITEEPLISKSFNRGENHLEAPGFTPWFDAYMKLYLQSIPTMEHEFIRNHLGIVFAVAANSENVMESLRTMIQLQQKQQHDNRSSAYPQYLSPNILKYYVLVQDVYETEDSTAHEIFIQMQQAYGSNFCHLLQINSRTKTPPKGSDVTQTEGQQPPMSDAGSAVVGGGNVGIADHWFTSASHRFCNVEARLFSTVTTSTAANTSGNAVVTPPASLTPVIPPKSSVNHVISDLDHPLAMEEKPGSPIEPLPTVNVAAKLSKVEYHNIGLHLTPNDLDRIRIFVREFCIRGLIPHIERHMRLFNDTVTNRKSRSLFSGAKRWFGKPGAASGTSVVYGKDAPELQIRKLGDLYFMIKLYKHAYNCYHTAKKDFQSDEAWNYYAGAAEMAALAQFMLNDPQKKYPSHYMEDSVSKYLHVCQLPEFAVRATLFDALCLKYNGLFLESAASYIRITNETKDLRSALLLEQASYCFLLANPCLVRKYAFHIILAGFRFSKCGQKKHSSRAYSQGYQLYKDKGWSLAEDHILYTMGHQKLLLKEHRIASQLFNDLLAMASPGLNPLQQMCHLREFFIVHHMHEKETKGCVSEITIPKIQAQQLVLDLTGKGASYDQLVNSNLGVSWQSLERIVVEQVRGTEFSVASKTSQPVFTSMTNNTVKPMAISGETIRLLLPVENQFQTPIMLKKINVLTSVDNVKSPETTRVVEDVHLDGITLEKNSRVILDLPLKVVGEEGDLNIDGISYGIRAMFPQSEATDYTIKGKQYFKVLGPRLNATKEHRTSVAYAKDHRLQMTLLPPMPKLDVKLSGVPESMSQGELRRVAVELRNVGQNSVVNVHMVHHHPGTLSVQPEKGRTRSKDKSLFPFPVVTDPSLKGTSDSGLPNDLPLDILPIDLACLDPGSSHALSLWLRGPEQLGTHTISVYFYYEAAKPLNTGTGSSARPALSYRMLKQTFVIKVIPSLTLTATRIRTCHFDNARRQTVLVGVNNASSVHGQEIYVSQLSLLSHSNVIERLVSANENVLVQKSESTVFGIQTRPSSQEMLPSTNNVCVSSVFAKGGQQFAIGESPQIDFLKGAFTFPARKTEAPTLSQDVVIVVWRSASAAGSSNNTGFMFVPVIDDSTKDTTDTTVDGVSTDTIDVGLPLLKRPCHLHLHVEKHFRHDFRFYGSPLLVPFSISVTNTGKEAGRFHLRAVKDWRSMDNGSACKYLGCTRFSTTLSVGSTKTFRFRLLVPLPGLYSCRGVHCQFVPAAVTGEAVEADGFPDEDELIPLEAAFIVSQI